MSSSPPQRRKVVLEREAKEPTYAWHAHNWREALATLGVDETGLDRTEWHRRRQRYGANAFTKRERDSVWRRLFKQLRSPLSFILLLAFLLTLVLREFVDAGVILFALLIAVVVGIVQEGRASRAFERLADSQVALATVFRDNGKHEVAAGELVPGDVVELLGGGQVPADVRLIKAKNLTINEAALTGEWLAVDKQVRPVSIGTPLSEQASMAFMGTFIASGNGIGVVVATGDRTAVGQLAQGLQTIVEEKTPLQHEMERISMVMFYIIGVLVLAIFAIGLWQNQSLHDMLLLSIAIAVASVPEGLPAAVTIILAVGMEALLRRGGLVRNLLAAETLGSTTYVLTDKTGTLTRAKMAVTGIMYATAEVAKPAEFGSNPLIVELLDTALCAADSYVDQTGGKEVLRGDPVEKAILEAAREAGIDPSKDSLRANREDYLGFVSENRFAAGLAPWVGKKRLAINGAPELLLRHATALRLAQGEVSISDEDRQAYEEAISVHTASGKRLVAVAYKDGDFADIPDSADVSLINGCVFLGVVILNDPVRKGVKEAIVGVQSAGACVLLITGDNPQTALSIAQQVGIAGAHERVLLGDELAELSDDEILELIGNVHVFARVLPNQKMRLAEILQRSGEIVAMTGDGINDAPALRKANIGIAIGSGTEVAKEASDLVLVNDSFETIYAAIEEGRRIIANLRKIVGYLVSTSLSEVVLIGAALIIGAPAPILPAQILWANIIEEGLMSVAFAFEKGEKRAMKRKPQDIHEEGVLSREMLWFLAFVVTILGILTLSLYFYVHSLNLPLAELRSVMFIAISMDSLFIAFAFRSLVTPIWRLPWRDNLFFAGSFLVSTLLLICVLSVPTLQRVLSYTPLPWELILLAVGFSAAALLVVEVGKIVFFKPDPQAT